VALKVFERLFVVLFLLFSMGVVIGLTRPYEAETDPGSVAAELHVTDLVFQTGVYCCGLCLIALRWKGISRAIKLSWPLLALALLALASVAWSTRPELTLRRSLLLLTSTLFSIYVGERYSIQQQVRILAYVFSGVMLTILLLRAIAPQYVVDYVSHPGAWKGLSGYKNTFGQYMATAALVFALVRFRRLSALPYVLFAVALAMLALAQSAGSVLCFVLVAPLIPLWRSTRISPKQRSAAYSTIAACLLVTMYLLATHSARVFSLLGRAPNLTGRSELWGFVWTAMMRRPVLGYGYDTFWTGMGEALDIRMQVGWMAQRSDNGFLDLGLGLGFVGLCVFLAVYVWAFGKAIAYLRETPELCGLWPVTYLTFYLLHNMTESSLLTRGCFPDLVFMMTVTSLALHRWGQRSGYVPRKSHEYRHIRPSISSPVTATSESFFLLNP
jgi:O-antigen ligase